MALFGTYKGIKPKAMDLWIIDPNDIKIIKEMATMKRKYGKFQRLVHRFINKPI